MSDDFRQKVKAFATRSVGIAPKCTNEESTKLFLVLPFLNLLGYDDRNPDEVCPEHGADFSEKYKNKVDYAILKQTIPIIAIECKAVGTALKDDRGQLRSYFNACQTIKMGVMTDGLVYEFYADTDEPNMMDQSAFLIIDLREIAKGQLEESVYDGLNSLQKGTFQPENIGAEAKRKLIFQNFIVQIEGIAEEPSEAFIRMLIQNAGISHVRTKALTEYRDLIRGAFREVINRRILQRLNIPVNGELEKSPTTVDPIVTDTLVQTDPATVPTVRELEVISYVKRRLAYLVKEHGMFTEIDHIDHRKYKGKLVVFYKRERSGRLFDYCEGKDVKHVIDFAQEGGEVRANNLVDIDAQLVGIFTKRVGEFSNGGKQLAKSA